MLDGQTLIQFSALDLKRDHLCSITEKAREKFHASQSMAKK